MPALEPVALNTPHLILRPLTEADVPAICRRFRRGGSASVGSTCARMKIKLDENMPESLVEQLGRLGHDVHTVPSESLSGKSDAKIWAAARSEQRFARSA
jgi:hypothetical protein